MVSQGVEFSLQTCHLADVGAHFFVDILNAPVNIMELLCDVPEIPDSSGWPYKSFGPPTFHFPPGPFRSLYAGFSRRSWWPRNSTFSRLTLLASCPSSCSHYFLSAQFMRTLIVPETSVNFMKIFGVDLNYCCGLVAFASRF
jgi:hypothetical protein